VGALYIAGTCGPGGGVEGGELRWHGVHNRLIGIQSALASQPERASNMS
jgi:hypothetical protein